MSNNSKRISIARAIEYKEIAKRNAERELECKRRGLWVLWQHQTQYKTLWHFLRASNDRLIMLCNELIDRTLDKRKGYLSKMIQFSQCYKKNPCEENARNISHYNTLYIGAACLTDELNEIRIKITGGKNNENQN